MSYEIDKRFNHHPPSDAADPAKRIAEHEEARAAFKETAEWADAMLPEGREKSLVITHLEEALFWANASIARQDFDVRLKRG